MIDLVIQCISNILFDNRDIASDFIANQPHVINDLINTIDRQPYETIKKGGFLRLTHIFFQSGQKNTRGLIPQILPMINDSME